MSRSSPRSWAGQVGIAKEYTLSIEVKDGEECECCFEVDEW